MASSTTSRTSREHGAALRLAALTLAGGALLIHFGACGDDGGALDGDSDGNGLGGCVLDDRECEVLCDDGLGCVECIVDADCGAAAPACAHGRCRECGVNTDCADGQACFPRDGKCETACRDDGDCDGDQEICDVDGGGRCVGCLADVDCRDEKRPVCDPVRARCVECAGDADCGAADPACDEHDGECRECNVDADCRSGSVCRGDHKCHDFCQSDVDCDDGKVCRTDDGDCVECLEDLQCGDALPFCSDRERCVECLRSEDCTADAAETVCDDERRCVECTDDAHCPDALPVCKDRRCWECDKDDDCRDPEFPKCQDRECSPD
jgi:hypothetical protein